MSRVYSTDIFKIYNNCEASKVKMWEMIRTFNPIEFAKLLYLLENVSTTQKRIAVSLPDNIIDYMPADDNQDLYLNLIDFPAIRLERGVYDNECFDVFWNNVDEIDERHDDFTINEMFEYIRSGNGKVLSTLVSNYTNFYGLESQNTMPCDNDDSGEKLMAQMNKLLPIELRFKVLNHNLGTTFYKTLLRKIEFLLFNDNYMLDRNEYRIETTSMVAKFLQFYKSMTLKRQIENDARNFRNLILERPLRIFDRQLMDKCSIVVDDGVGLKTMKFDENQPYIVQPLYQGMHVIVYSSPNETKCYNRYGELQIGIAYSLRSPAPCTFEAVILPVDRYGNARCWRYWQYRTSYIMYIVDVFRYKQTILMHTPFVERLKYIDKIIHDNYTFLFKASIDKSWSTIEQEYTSRRDIYDPIVGVVLRRYNHTLMPMENNKMCEKHDTVKSNDGVLTFYFNIFFSFDLLKSTIVDLRKFLKENDDKSELIHRLHLNYEMADYKTICIAYSHCETYIYLCEYNRKLHQFEHVATLQRSPMEYFQLQYKSERIYVVNNRAQPLGVMYLRIYYDVHRNIIGYERKITDDRFKLPYTNPLFESMKNKMT